MIRTPDSVKRYHSAHERFLKPAIVSFFKREFSGLFGPVIRENIADALIDLFESTCPESTRLKPGQMIWNALDKNTRGDRPNRRFKPVILTLVCDDDISLLEKGTPIKQVRQNVIARLINEAYKQDGALSTRDLCLFYSEYSGAISHRRIAYEKKHQTILPHTGVLHDMGSTLTHKKMIVYKHIVEKKDPTVIAKETNHSQSAVDRYLKDFNRVRTLMKDSKDVDYIHHTTNIAKAVIKQYQQLVNKYVKEL
ncbi:MAG: DUF1670 domain-containing protein [Bacteroidetes bacterium]|nr:DUF1670 domain-containing protein [Bacteroidota bacterium]